MQEILTRSRFDSMPVSLLRGVGPRVAGRLARLGIASVQDLLFHLPLRYQDRTRVARIADLRAGDEALAILASYSARHPNGELREEAAIIKMDALRASGER